MSLIRRLPFVAALAVIMVPLESVAQPTVSREQNASEGGLEEFQLRFVDAYHSMATTKLGKERKVPFNIAPGEKYLMSCSPEKIASRDKEFAISFGNIDIPKSFSLIFVNEFRQIHVVAATSTGAYIDDNTIQPELIKKNSVVTTGPLTTYAHMDDTGYPYGAFGPSGTYLILLVDDAIDFGQRGTKMERGRLPGGIYTDRGKMPTVIAGCAVTWTDLVLP